MPHAVLQKGLTGDHVLFLEGSVLLALEPVVVEDVQGAFCGLCAFFREGKKDVDRRLADLLPLALGGGPDVPQASDKLVHREGSR